MLLQRITLHCLRIELVSSTTKLKQPKGHRQTMEEEGDTSRVDSMLSSPEPSPTTTPTRNGNFLAKVSDELPAQIENVVLKDDTEAKASAPATVNLNPSPRNTGIDFSTCSQILVGYSPSPSCYAVPTTLLTQHSPFFHNRYQPQWGRDTPQNEPIYLPHVHPDTFNTFLNWLYSTVTATNHPLDLPGSPETLTHRKCTRCHQTRSDWHELFLLDMYIFAHPLHYHIPSFLPLALSSIQRFYHRQQALPSRAALELALNSLPADDELVLSLMAFYVFALREGRMYFYEPEGLGASLAHEVAFWFHYAGRAEVEEAKGWKVEVREKVQGMQSVWERVRGLCAEEVVPRPCGCVGREDGFSGWLMK